MVNKVIYGDRRRILGSKRSTERRQGIKVKKEEVNKNKGRGEGKARG